MSNAKLRLSKFYGELVRFSCDDSRKRYELTGLSEKDKNEVTKICQSLELKIKPYKKGKTLVITRDFGDDAESSSDSELERFVKKQMEDAEGVEAGPSVPGKGKGKGKGGKGDDMVMAPPKKKKRLRITDLDEGGNLILFKMKARDLIDTYTNKLKSLARLEAELQREQRYNKALLAAQKHLGIPSAEDLGSSGGEWVESDGDELLAESSSGDDNEDQNSDKEDAKSKRKREKKEKKQAKKDKKKLKKAAKKAKRDKKKGRRKGSDSGSGHGSGSDSSASASDSSGRKRSKKKRKEVKKERDDSDDQEMKDEKSSVKSEQSEVKSETESKVKSSKSDDESKVKSADESKVEDAEMKSVPRDSEESVPAELDEVDYEEEDL